MTNKPAEKKEPVRGSGVGVSALQELIVKWRDISARPNRPTGFRLCADELETVLSSLQPPNENANQSLREGSTVPVREPEATPNNWRPIETAPRGEMLILYFPKDERHRLHIMVRVETFPCSFPRKPTHWLPLPPLPGSDDEA
jgi:hypothetical protein